MADVLEVDPYANDNWILAFDGRVLEIFGKIHVPANPSSGWDADAWRVHVRQLNVKVTGPDKKGVREVGFCSPSNPTAYKTTFEFNDEQWSRVQPLLDALAKASSGTDAASSRSDDLLATKSSALQTLLSQHDIRLGSQPEDVRRAVVSELQAASVPIDPNSFVMRLTNPGQVDAVFEIYQRHGLLPPDATLG
jgi:hypothetical protein